MAKLGELFGISDDDGDCDCGCEEFEVDDELEQWPPEGETVAKAVLTAATRKRLPRSAFAIPEKAPGSGSYPIHDLAHAKNALARSSGKPEAGRVRAAVCRRYPRLPACQQRGRMAKDDGSLEGEMELGDRVEALEQKLDTLIGDEGPLAKITEKIDALSEKEEEPPTVEAVNERLEAVAKEINDKLSDLADDVEAIAEGEPTDTDERTERVVKSNGEGEGMRGILFDYED